ncbi:hypothetical protein DFS34DRAFT_597742 [Phlyctochytrium arcticum]|nr:hypothetical protein DFS34DRAFT_597742 [Phlyctochytrium arcticum]
MFLEKQILDHVDYFIKREKYIPNQQETVCIKKYEYSPYLYTLANFVLWGNVAYYLIDMRSLTGPGLRKATADVNTPSATKTATPTAADSIPKASSTSTTAARRTIPPAGSIKPPRVLIQRPVMPRWIALWGMAACTAGSFAGIYYTSKLAARDCIQCILNEDDKKSELYKTVKTLLVEHHPDARTFLAEETKSSGSI